MPESWDRQPGEPERGYDAFLVYRDLGPERSVPAAYRQRSGNDLAKQAGGQWNAWSKAFHWKSRALAYDHHTARVAQDAVDKVTAAQAEKWAARRDARAEVDWQLAEDLTRKVQVWAKMPPVSRTALADGRTLVEAVGIRETKDVAAIAQAASQMAYAAINVAIPDPDAYFDYEHATTEELRAALERVEAKISPRIARAG